ncbi:MAG TPA: phage tail protein, partial [Bryobacteraceae bacterium]|nr:phage tail protein [Bryobacteraceae bacterium]
MKELSITETPLFLVECRTVSGAIERWSTHRVAVDGVLYEPRILRHNLFEIRAEADDAIDGVSRVSITLGNADSHCSQIERGGGWKGARVTVWFLFFDLKHGQPASEKAVIFRGVANPPDEITESTMRLTVSNRMNLQRLLLPEVRIQKRCPWKFPSTVEQRAGAATGGSQGKYSPFFRCGYSADVAGGEGNLNGGSAYSSCNYTRASCAQRGMFDVDTAGHTTRRFGGIEFVPSTTLVRSYGEKGHHVSPVAENEGRYNDFVPLVYGTAWYAPPVVFARNDGNLTHLEVLLGMGEIEGALKVLVNDIEIPLGRQGADMTATGWYSIVSQGSRTGAFNPDFGDQNGSAAGDPYGSMAVLSLVTPNRINDGRSLPRVQVLLQGLRLATYSTAGEYLGEEFSNNPAWVILDILRRSGWSLEEIDTRSFARTAEFCAQMIDGADLYGGPLQMPRFQSNLVVRKRRSAAELIRGIRNGSRLYLTLGMDGRLQLNAENNIALQQPVKPQGSNSSEPLNGGWPCYEFGDGTSGFPGILRRENGEPAIRLWTRSTADTPNRFSVEFQDALNEYQQDSLSLVDVDDALRAGQEISVPLQALGIPNFHQAARAIQIQLDKSVRGNTYVEFETSVRGVQLKPGDIIALTYLKEGFQRQPFRIRSISPGDNFGTAVIVAQIHDDALYTDEVGGATGAGGRRQPGFEVGIPRPLIGSVLDAEGEPQFEITERADETSDGQMKVWLSAGFVAPSRPSPGGGNIPMLSLSPDVFDTGGALAGDQTLYYAVSALGAEGDESPLSFLARAVIPPGTNTNRVRLTGLRLGPETASFRVYRGSNPSHLFRIAGGQPPAAEFTDPGFEKQLATAPDENYDHANFYWRFELLPEIAATLHSAETIGNGTLQMAENEYRGM